VAAVGAQTAYIAPSSPREKGYRESFNSKLRNELLNGKIFYALTEAQVPIEVGRDRLSPSANASARSLSSYPAISAS
jgi:hypothetical protein